MMTHGVTHFTPDTCPGCRYKTIQFSPLTFQPHFNHSVGAYVNTDKEFRDELKRCSERNSIATGTDHNYEPRYNGDLKPITSADSVLDTRARNLSSALGQVVSYD